MQSYTVYEPPNPPADRLKRAERLVFVYEGFSWMAALFGPLWMLVHRMWLALILYIIVATGIEFALVSADASAQWITVATIALHLVVGFEAGTLRRWALERRGWRMLGAVTGKSRIDCERRFFQAWLGEKSREENEGSVPFKPEPREASTEKPGPVAGLTAAPAGSQA